MNRRQFIQVTFAAGAGLLLTRTIEATLEDDFFYAHSQQLRVLTLEGDAQFHGGVFVTKNKKMAAALRKSRYFGKLYHAVKKDSFQCDCLMWREYLEERVR